MDKNLVTSIMHTGVGRVTSLVANDEVVFKIFFFLSCQGILKLTDRANWEQKESVRGDEYCNRVQVRKPEQSTWSVYCTGVVKSRILRHSRLG